MFPKIFKRLPEHLLEPVTAAYTEHTYQHCEEQHREYTNIHDTRRRIYGLQQEACRNK